MRITSMLALVGVLGAGSAAAAANSQVLTNSDASADAVATASAAVTESATQVYSSALTETQLMYQVGDAGFITLDTAGNVLTIVSATANPGWELVSSLEGRVEGAAGSAHGVVDGVTNGLPEVQLPEGQLPDGLPSADGSANGQVDISINGVTNGSADGTVNGSSDGTADGSLNASLNDQLDGADSATDVAVLFQNGDDAVEFTASLLTDGTVETAVEPNPSGVLDANGTADDEGTDGTGNGNGTGTDGTDDESGVDDANGTADDDADDCTGDFIAICVAADADAQVNDD